MKTELFLATAPFFNVIENFSFPITLKTLREEKKKMLRIPLKHERVASDSLLVIC